MSDSEPNPAFLAPPERMRRIADLLAKAILLSESKRALRVEDARENNASTFNPFDSDAERVLQYLQVAGHGSPAAIRCALGLSKATAYRTLLRLSDDGYVVAKGQTRTLAYYLAEREPPAEKLALN